MQKFPSILPKGLNCTFFCIIFFPFIQPKQLKSMLLALISCFGFVRLLCNKSALQCETGCDNMLILIIVVLVEGSKQKKEQKIEL